MKKIQRGRPPKYRFDTLKTLLDNFLVWMTQSDIVDKTPAFTSIRDKYQPLKKHLDHFLGLGWVMKKSIKELMKDEKISEKTIIEMLKRKNVNEESFAFKIVDDFENVFLPAAKSYLKSENNIDFFASKFVQHFISDEKKIMNSIEENLGIKFDEKTRKHYYNVISKIK